VVAKDRLYRAVNGLPLLNTVESPAFRDQLRLAEQASRTGPGQIVDSGLGLARAAITLAGLAAAVALISPWVAGTLFASAIPVLVAEIKLSRQRAQMIVRISPAERRELFYADLLTNLSAAKEVRLFGAGRLFHRRMLAELTTTHGERRRLDRRELIVQVGLAAGSAVLIGAALVLVLLAAARGRLTVGDVAAVIVATSGMQAALSAAVDHVAMGHHAGLLFDHYRTLVEGGPVTRAEPRPAAARAEPRPAADRGIELDDVWFRYADGQPWVLRGVNVRIRADESVALVGANGSGKSTLVKLLCRLYEPTRGTIRWDGADLRDLPIDALRQRISAVFQDFMSYELTAAENVALGGVDGADEVDSASGRIAEAAHRAEVGDALERLPHGYQTMLSRTFVDYQTGADDGVLLSGGQWQRLALARALLRGGRELLILDEPSSGLDAEAEHRIHRHIADYRAGRMIVHISHRLNTVRDADRILVLADGRVVEEGTHDQLLGADGRYARLFHRQAAGYQPDRVASP
jgi:ATP-binding cassette subfamily B protein